MKILSTIAEVRALLKPVQAAGGKAGVMGTSGKVHDGHLSLIRRAVAENEVALMFWMGGMTTSWSNHTRPPGYDDRDWNKDLPLIESTGIKYAYVPNGDDYSPRRPVTITLVPQLASECPPMEKEYHLNLVSTATAKLYNIFGPMRYYSGEKDWQQLAMFKRMAEDLATEVEVVGCAVIRDADGLALSSRNARLTAEDRKKAPALYETLMAGVAAIEAGERSSAVIEKLLNDRLNAVGESVYANAVDAESLQSMETLKGEIRLIASLKLGDVPLVDNVGVTVT